METNEQIIKEVMEHIKSQHQAGINYLIKKSLNDLDGPGDINRAWSIAREITKDKKFIIEQGHTKDDVWIIKNPDYEKWKVEFANAKRTNDFFCWVLISGIVGFIISVVLGIIRLIEYIEE